MRKKLYLRAHFERFALHYRGNSLLYLKVYFIIFVLEQLLK